jgi:hypothetical protein
LEVQLLLNPGRAAGGYLKSLSVQVHANKNLKALQEQYFNSEKNG